MQFEWVKKHCPVCGRRFEYVTGQYQPKTCANFDCVRSYVMHPDNFKSLTEHLDDCRKQARI